MHGLTKSGWSRARRLLPSSERLAAGATALSVANLFRIPLWREVQATEYQETAGYAVPVETGHTLEWAALTCFAVFGLLLFACVCVLRFLPQPIAKKGKLWIPIIVAAALAAHLFAGTPGLGLALYGGALVFTLATIWRPRSVSAAARATALVLFPVALLNVTRTTWAVCNPHPASRPLQPSASLLQTRSPASPRVLWLVFDELDQHLAFQKRPHGLSMTEFDRFRSESFHAEEAQSPGEETLAAIPGMTTGTVVRSAELRMDGRLQLTHADGNTSVWGNEATIFHDIRTLGLSTAVVGWYHPYCLVLGRDLDICEQESTPAWGPGPLAWREYSDSIGFWNVVETNVARTFHMAHKLRRFDQRQFAEYEYASWELRRKEHARCYRQLHDTALRLAVDPRLNLLLVHVPVPHPPGIYDRRIGKLSAQKGESYLDNLALADRFLGEIRRASKQRRGGTLPR